MRSFLGTLAVLCFSLQPAYALEMHVNKLTDQVVRDFVKDTNALTAGINTKPKTEVMQYLEDHIDPNVKFSISMTLNVNGMAPNTQSMEYSKSDYIATVAQSLDNIQAYDGDINIDSLNIAANGAQAIVKTHMDEKADIPLPQPDGSTKIVPVLGQSKCEQTLTLNQGVIQVFRANCNTEYTVTTQ